MDNKTDPQRRRVDQLRPGDVVRAADQLGHWQEVVAAEPITGEPCVTVLFRGGTTQRLDRAWTVELADAATAEQWRTEQATNARRRQLAAELADLADMIRDGRIPAHTSGAAIQLFGLSRDEVVGLAVTLGAQPPEVTGGSRNLILRTELRPGSLLTVTAVASTGGGVR